MKPTIRYVSVFPEPRRGSFVYLNLAERHHDLSVVTRNIRTSEIVSAEPDGTFETLNTIYKKDR